MVLLLYSEKKTQSEAIFIAYCNVQINMFYQPSLGGSYEQINWSVAEQISLSPRNVFAITTVSPLECRKTEDGQILWLGH